VIAAEGEVRIGHNGPVRQVISHLSVFSAEGETRSAGIPLPPGNETVIPEKTIPIPQADGAPAGAFYR